MPVLLLRLVVVAAVAFVAGATLTPVLWRTLILQESKAILSPFAMLSAGILITAVCIAVAQIRKLL
jgi:hypothetical protein